MIRHGGLIARREPGGWRGVLIEGGSGSGKSDLMLRALSAGWTLVADDRVVVWSCGENAYGRAPDTLAGLMEIRGLGVLAQPFRAFAVIALVVRLVPPEAMARMPEPASTEVAGRPIPAVDLVAWEASCVDKLACALSHLGLPL
ncbi:MAG: HPr kinase/phosphorylase [Caulobacteraceae bacterium]|nr:HPr kinase/phosphorylase [Caulobacteraceae bacterium]